MERRSRLDFDRPDSEFAAYAKAVVDYETAAEIPQRKHAALWMPVNGDLATNLLYNDVGLPFLRETLGSRQGFALSPFLAAEATKENPAEHLYRRGIQHLSAAGAAIHGFSRPGKSARSILPINENVRVRWLVRSGYRAIGASERTLSLRRGRPAGRSADLRGM